MALSDKSLFLYNYEVTANNQYLEFASNNTQTPSTAWVAAIPIGFYSLTGLLEAIASAMGSVDTANVYTLSADRTVMGGLENRVTISTSGSFLTLFFGSGIRAVSDIRQLLGFSPVDQTGSTTYTGSSSSGVALIPTLVGYNYLSPDFIHTIFGSVNVSATGEKESIVYTVQKFWEVQFKYEPKAKAINEWRPFLDWAIQQKLFEFTPEISSPTVFYEGTLERSSGDGKGLGYILKEMLPQFPNLYDTGGMRFRQRNIAQNFI